MASEVAEAVPAPKGISEEELERAQANLKEGKSLIDDDPEKAVELLCAAVRAYEKHYGSDALECADVYLYYGIALFEVARASTDALGRTQTTVQQAADQEGAGPSGSGADAEGAKPAAEGASADAAAAAEKAPADADASPEAEEKDKEAAAAAPADAGEEAPAADADAEGGAEGAEAEGDDAAGPEGGAEGEGEGADGDAEGEANEGEGDDGVSSDDMKLAWEMIELAHVIYRRNGPEAHQSKLAEVHKALADIAGEQERFDEAVELYKKSIEHLQAMQPPNKRRVAEVQYTLSVMLTFQEAHEEALQQTEAALASLGAAVAEVDEKLAALPTDGSGGEAAEEEGRRLQATIDDLRGVMAELQHNCEGLRDTIKHNNSLKEALKEAFAKASGLGGDPSGAFAATLSKAFAAPSKAAGAGQPVSLGVVGRGTKRITLQPAAAAAPADAPAAAAATAAQPAEAADAAAAAPAPAAGGKRTLGDMLNGGGPSPAAAPANECGEKAATGGGEVAEAEGKENVKRARVEEVA